MLKRKIIKLLEHIMHCTMFDEDGFVMYLASGEALPPALSAEEEQELILQLDNNSEFAKHKLIEHNLRLVIYIAKKFERNDVELEDLISIGSIGLIKAINSFKGDKNIKIATYASRCIENEILMYLRKIARQKGEVSFDETLSTDGDGNELVLGDLVPSAEDLPQDDLEDSVEKQMLMSIIDGLNPREREIMIMRFGLNGKDEMTQKEVADDLGISQSYISRLEKKIVSKIKREMLRQA